MIKVITSKDNPKIKSACALKEAKYRNEAHLFLGESKKSLMLAIQAGVVKEVFTYEALDISENIPQYLVNEVVMKKLSSSKNPEGVVFVCNYPIFKKDNFSKILYLDEINDPGNLGTMIRTALAFNFDAVVTSPNSVSIYNEKTLAACKGSNYLIPVFSKPLNEIKRDHKVIVTTLNDDSIDVNELEKPDKFILVMGNEAHGISKEIIRGSDIKVKIAISNIDSLNVAVAAAILMHKLA
ncbi:MAG: RNA methyltransferase [Bacilli bacterium]|nr:RNA methyltransferase [Bacilli bacterium]